MPTRRTRIDAAARDALATIIVSVYRDVEALRCILSALGRQTQPRFQIIVSEDGEDPLVRRFLKEVRPTFPGLLHLTQPDCGFRKTRALNRAVCEAASDRLIFLDGDCVPHRRFVENHLRYTEANAVCVGRRVQLGPRMSQRLRNAPRRIALLDNRLSYLLLGPLFHLDRGRNYEVGFASSWLQSLRGSAGRFILGCNFACSKADLLAINGFDEDFVQAGVGEDTDLEWRFERRGLQLKSVRFVAPVYHLYHETRWTTSTENERILAAAKQRGEVYCRNGIVKSEESVLSATP